jgi:hypothetical protein
MLEEWRYSVHNTVDVQEQRRTFNSRSVPAKSKRILRSTKILVVRKNHHILVKVSGLEILFSPVLEWTQ